MSKKGHHVAKAKKKRRRNRQWYAELHGLHFEHRQPRDVGPGLSPPDNLDLALAWTLAMVGRRKTSMPELPKEKP